MGALHLLLSSPLKAQNAGLFISRGNGAIHPTRVISSYEIIFVIQGHLDIWEEGEQFHLEAGQILLLFPGRKHGGSAPMPPDLKFYWLHFEIEEIDSKPSIGGGLMILPQTTTLARPENMERIFRFFLSEQESGKMSPVTADLLTLLILNEVSHQTQETPSEDEVNVVATWAHSYIYTHFDQSITASKVAAALGYNVDYLGRIYRQTYDCTLTDAIHQRRIQKACKHLLNSNLTISQIATICGFKDADYFRRIFKRTMKISPGEYREEYSRMHVMTH